MKWNDLTEEQKELARNLWVKHLDKYCPADDVGNRPCDWGCPCDKCHHDPFIQQPYKDDLIKHGIGID